MLLKESGFAPTNPPEWIAKLRPQALLLSVAAGDQDGRPDRKTIEAIQGYPLLRTDQDRWIELTTDGEQLWVEMERR
jgi:beta-lactamase superfamily II metal-dependent hydrolase